MPRISPLADDTDLTIASRKTTILVDAVSKRFNATPVLADIDLEVRAGELLALLGASGSGKTTLLRIIAGLEVPDSGRIAFSGADTTRVPVQKREVGFVFQHYALFKHMTVADNIAYGLTVRPRASRPPRVEIRRRVDALLDLIKLTTFADRYPSQLSGGQRQRVALARALAVEPRVLLLDEPFGALDAQVRKDLRRWLREIHERTGQTTIFVTHDQDEALELSDRVAILHAGRLEQIGTPAQVQDHPASIAVLKFLGDALEVPAQVDDGQVFVDGCRVDVAANNFAGKVSVFVRPWQFQAESLDKAHIRGTVKTSYRAEGLTHLNILTDTGQMFVATMAMQSVPAAETRIGLKISGGHTFARQEIPI